jgi:hypothetical protein
VTTDLQSYRTRLLLALRERDVPGPRIAEALAEVESHVADTGEEPESAFGPPRQYADAVASALSGDGRPLGEKGWVTWGRAAACGAAGWIGADALIDGAVGVSSGEPGAYGTPAALSLGVGALVLALLAGWFVLFVRRQTDVVLDPRTGRDMAPVVPPWAWAVMAAPLVLAVAVAVVLGLAAD